jgi:CheY-like chemotaxis protein
MPQLIETVDFYTFNIMPIYGKNAQNKGMALFPKKINGKYAMLSRHDGENNFIMFSDQVNNWDEEAILIQEPVFPWEFVQLGNSGSPIETSKGWLVITHGVGAMRRYVLGAILLDKNIPSKVLAQLTNPLLVANETEREGYVPNVVYSCGSILHNDDILIPYAMSDTSSGFAHVALKEIFDNMVYTNADETDKQSANRKKILIVEDDIVNITLLNKILEDEGYQVDAASDGLNALVAIGKNKYDLILSDITMPNFTGYQLLEFLQLKEINIPVVFLSGHTSEDDEIKGLKLGAVEYLRKPVKSDLLRLRLKNIFSN